MHRVETALERDPSKTPHRNAHTWWTARSPEFKDVRGVPIIGWGNSRLDAVANLSEKLPSGTQLDAKVDKLEVIKQYAELQQQMDVLTRALQQNMRVYRIVAEDEGESFRSVEFDFNKGDSMEIMKAVHVVMTKRLKEVEAILGIAGF